ncbi:alpha/beta fold hydrolase [Sulfitobacter sp. HNIBRBA3233]|uniref:alpha/beta hydrolase n=1 Tax=Sulfitobacter marinivivus TaxID=3158558 RepID=UPI0032E0342C
MPVLRPSRLLAPLALVVALWSVYALESARWPVVMDNLRLGGTPATLYRGEAPSGSLVIVAHGFAGSRQMMEAISLTLARAGHTVVAFDFIGHGRHPAPLSPAIGTLTSTTEDLVQQTVRVARAAQQRTGIGEVSFVGHSMATDVVVRAAERIGDTGSVVAISMYSEAVTPAHPARLLIVSGAFESRLRDVALDAVAQLGPAEEGTTITTGETARRAVSAPWVGHVGVLWSRSSLSEIAAWLGQETTPVRTGPWLLALLAALVVLFRPVSQIAPACVSVASPQSLRRAALAASVPAVAAAVAAMTALPLAGLAGFGGLALALGVWGVLVLSVLRRVPRLARRELMGALVLVTWGIGAFALALDRYGAAFVPTGPRLLLAVLLLPACVVFAVADRALVAGRGLLARIALRIPFVVALAVAMMASPAQFGLVFTVLPVLALYWLVYGTMAMWLAKRSGPVAAGLGAGVILAWAIAASTPLFQGVS